MTNQTSSRHPLLEKKIIGIASWEQWLKRWNAVTTAEELISLLHYGFDAGSAIYQQDTYAKAAFYLGIADGHADWDGKYIGNRTDDLGRTYYTCGVRTSLYQPKPPHQCHYSSIELRRLIAKKAWEVLIVKFFGGWVPNQGSRGSPGWFHYWGDQDHDIEFLKVLFDFLDPKHGVNNLSTHKEPHRNVLEDFMQGFIETAWRQQTVSPGWTGRPYSEKKQACRAIADLCYDSRPRLLNMVSALGWEKMLLKLPYDERTIPHLEAEVAAQNKGMPSRDGTLEEWAAGDYKPAQIVLLLRNQMKVDRMRKKEQAA